MPNTQTSNTTGEKDKKSAQWFVANTKPRQEQIALQQLENQNYRVYLPFFRKNQHKSGRWQTRREVLFPGYLFIQLDLKQDNIAPIRSTIGMRNLVRFGQLLVPIPRQIVNALREQEKSQFDSTPQPTEQFQSGDVIQLIDGPFKGLEAIYKVEKSADRVLVLLELMGKQTPVAVDINTIIPRGRSQLPE